MTHESEGTSNSIWYAVKYYHTKFKDPSLVTIYSLALTVTLLTFEAFFTDTGELLL